MDTETYFNIRDTYPIVYGERDIELFLYCKREKANKIMNGPFFPSFMVGEKLYVERKDMIKWAKQRGYKFPSDFDAIECDKYSDKSIFYTVDDIKNIFHCSLNRAYSIMKEKDMISFVLDGTCYVERTKLINFISNKKSFNDLKAT